MQRNDPDATPRISRFADRLARRATMVANAREGYATTLHAHDCDMLFVPVAGRFDIVDARGEQLQSAPGHFIWFAAGTAHATTAQTLRQTHIAVYVDPDLWGTALRAQGVDKPLQGMRSGSAGVPTKQACRASQVLAGEHRGLGAVCRAAGRVGIRLLSVACAQQDMGKNCGRDPRVGSSALVSLLENPE